MNEIFRPQTLPHEIVTEKELKLRFIRPDDAEAVFVILQEDPSIQTDFINWVAGANSVEDIRARIETFQTQPGHRYAITNQQDKIVGYIGVSRDGSEANEYDIGYFCAPSQRGQGYVGDAMQSIIEKIESMSRPAVITLYIRDDNEASQAVAEKFGFVQTDETINNKVLDCVERRWELSLEVD